MVIATVGYSSELNICSSFNDYLYFQHDGFKPKYLTLKVKQNCPKNVVLLLDKTKKVLKIKGLKK